MHDHLTASTLERLRRRDLASADMLEVQQAIVECAVCQDAANAAARSEDWMNALEATLLDAPWTHLDDDLQTFAYVEGRLGDVEREIVESHLEDCDLCQSVVRDVRSLRERAAFRRRRNRLLAGLAAAASTVLVLMLALQAPEKHRIATSVKSRVTDTAARVTATSAAPELNARDYENPEWSALVRKTIADAHVAISPAILSLRSWPTQVRGDGGHESAISVSPSGTAVREERPTLSWPAAGRTYRARVFRDEKQVADSGPIIGSHWKVNRTLARQKTYVWQVEVDGKEIIPPPAQPPASFRIISIEEEQELALAKAKHPDDHLLLGALLARAGLVYEAQEEFRRWRAASPESKVARRLDENLRNELLRTAMSGR